MTQSGPINCESAIVRPDIWFTSILPCVLNRQSLVNDLARETLQVRPKFLKTVCQLLGAYIIYLLFSATQGWLYLVSKNGMLTTRCLYHFTDHFRRPKDRCTRFPV